ncbi:MAG: NACHT domain-containing protein [Symploca sp. SIO1C2]|nr:NACHT domain-containing protein [Symploca sp. SIO1C2]
MLNLKESSAKRQRGVVLSEQGLTKILEARRYSEQQENYGKLYTVEELAERTGLASHTLGKVFRRDVKVDKRTLQLCFSAFNLTLETDDYQKPQSLKEKVEAHTTSKSFPDHSKTVTGYDTWGEIPDITDFCGRTTELAQLKQWILWEHCRFVIVSGQSGIGKTFLTAKLVDQLHGKFDLVIWRSLSTLPPIREFLTELIQSFPHSAQEELPNNVQGKLSRLVHCLRTIRCLLVLDGIESVLQVSEVESQTHTSRKIPDCDWYQRLLKRLAEVLHNSCVVVTTCQKQPEIKHFVGDNSPRRFLHLQGLSLEDCKALCNREGILSGTQTDWENLMNYYGGNPLFLKIAATTIHNLFNSNIGEFLHCNVKLYGEICQKLDQQFRALSASEVQLLCYLAQQPNHISFKELQEQSPPLMPLQAIIEALEELAGRGLIKKQGDYFVLQPVLRDYGSAKCKAIAPSG